MKNIRITLYSRDRWNPPPGKLQAFIQWLQGLLSQVPSQYQDQVTIENETDYDGCHTYEIYYYRPETPEELVIRLRQDSEFEELERQAEIEQLHKLKAKYPDA